MAANTHNTPNASQALNGNTTFRYDPKTQVASKNMTVTCKAWGPDQSVNMQVEIDFTGVAHEQLISWASQTLIINLQASLRKCDLSFVKELAKQPYRRKATAMGVLDDPNRAFRKTLENLDTYSPEQLEQLLARAKQLEKKLGK